jgi:pantoate--beta-alanine ligase
MTTRWITTVSDMQAFSANVRSQAKSLALVPTMGALHEGHLTLVEQAKRECDAVAVSIFVNPAQFRPGEDFGHYPRTPERDLEALRPFNVDAVFAPESAEMYPAGFATFLEPGRIASVFEGAMRPGHFRGVATVVLKLFNIVHPDVAVFGQKDFQQVAVLHRMVNDLNLPVRLTVVPIVRDADGLAKSSRNAFLNEEDRKAALVLSRSLKRAEEMCLAGEQETPKLLEEIRGAFSAEPSVQLDYAVIVSPAMLEPVAKVTPGSVALVAGRVGAVRLIDNHIFGPPGSAPAHRLQLALMNQPVEGKAAESPAPEIKNLCTEIERCRDCAAISTVTLPPRQFLVKHLKRDDPKLESIRVLVVGR